MFSFRYLIPILAIFLFCCDDKATDSLSSEEKSQEVYFPVNCEADLDFNPSFEEEKKDLYKVLLIDKSMHVENIPSFMIDFMNGLKKRGWHIFDSAEMKGSIKEDLAEQTGVNRYPDVLAIYNANTYMLQKWSQIFKPEMKKSILIQWVDEVQEVQIQDGLKYALDRTDAIFPRYHHAALRVLKSQVNCFMMPHAATDHFFKDLREDKSETVLLSGAIKNKYYHLRVEAARLLVTGNKSIVHRKHPGYNNGNDPEMEAKTYAEEISMHSMAIAGGGLPPDLPGPFIYAKHFEIAAAGTAMITDEELIPYLRELGFNPFEHYIPTHKNLLEQTIEYWLDPIRRDELRAITKRGQDLVREKHRNEHRIENFDRIAVKLFHQKQRKN